jgi:formylglycine-generating enzyme required for sulfatase activity
VALPVAATPEHVPVTVSVAVASAPAPVTGSVNKTNIVPWAVAACMVLGLIAVGKNASNERAEVAAAQVRDAEQRAVQAEREKQELIAEAKAKAEADKQAADLAAAKAKEEVKKAADKAAAKAAKEKEEAEKEEGKNATDFAAAKAAKEKEEAEKKVAEQQRLAELARENTAKAPVAVSKEKPFENSLGMKFVPVGIQTGGKTVLFSIWETRRQDYEAYANANRGVNTKWKNPGFEQTGEHPVVCVGYEDAVAFCAWLSQRERAAGKIDSGDEYRLPSDEEWSFAVGIGEKEDANATPKEKDLKIKDVWPWGTRWPPPEGAGNYDSYTSRITVDGYDRTSPVGKFQKNTHGLYDLGGNVWECCGSYFDGSSGTRVLRGGSWYDDDDRVYLLSSCRGLYYPGRRSRNFGFRCVLVSSR